MSSLVDLTLGYSEERISKFEERLIAITQTGTQRETSE